MYLHLLFLVCFALFIGIIINIVKIASIKSGFSNHKTRKLQVSIGGFLLFYLGYTTLLCFLGVTNENTIPPKIFLYAAIPLAVICFIVSHTNTFKQLFKTMSLESLIGFHLIRFIGIFFLVGYAYNLLPSSFAYTGGLGDIISAIGAIVVIYCLKKQLKQARKLVYIWNIVGLIDISSVLLMAILITQESIQTGEVGILNFTLFPFIFIPALAPVGIVFCHILIFKKLQSSSAEA